MEEKAIRKFVNELGFALEPNNQSMKAVRIIRERMPDFVDTIQTMERNRVVRRIQEIADTTKPNLLLNEIVNKFYTPENDGN